MRKDTDVYLIGVAIEIISIICLSRSYVKCGDITLPLIAFIIGFLLIIMGYLDE